MKSAKAKKLFVAHLTQAGEPLSQLSPAAGVAAMMTFYKSERADDCDIDSDGDMLLFQWGTYDWGDGEHFGAVQVREEAQGARDGGGTQSEM